MAVCGGCNREFERKRSDQKFCSPRCKANAFRERKNKIFVQVPRERLDRLEARLAELEQKFVDCEPVPRATIRALNAALDAALAEPVPPPQLEAPCRKPRRRAQPRLVRRWRIAHA